MGGGRKNKRKKRASRKQQEKQRQRSPSAKDAARFQDQPAVHLRQQQLKPDKTVSACQLRRQQGFYDGRGILLLSILVLLAASGTILYQGRTLPSLKDTKLMNDLAELKITQRIYDGFPSISQNLSKISHNLGSYSGVALSVLIGSIKLPIQLLMQRNLPRPGLTLRDAGYRPKHPTIIIPGFVTSGLELWETLPCAKEQFRTRIWGTWAMTSSFLWAKQCWIDHLRLDEVTGLDPKGVKVRASQGLEAVDYFIAGYHVWAQLIEAFADLGYDSNNLITEPYDWRLAVPDLETRDYYFTRLKARIEVASMINHQKVLVVSHSFGDTVFRIFMSWVSHRDPHWVEKHIAVYTNIAGPTLGVPKAISALLSGETRDTAELGYLTAILANAHFTRGHRRALIRTWGGGIGMLPAGGTVVWGNSTWAPDDRKEMQHTKHSLGSMMTVWETTDENADASKQQQTSLLNTFRFGSSGKQYDDSKIRHLDVMETLDLLTAEAGPNFQRNVDKWSAVPSKAERADAGVCKRCNAWSTGQDFHYDPFKCPLPRAPSLKMFCLYGVGNPTERSYQYEHLRTEKAFQAAKQGATGDDDPTELDVRYKLHTDVDNPRTNLDSGVRLTDGDGTVPLISLGTLCRKHWRDKGLNPSRFQVTTREYPHRPRVGNPLFNYMRGGPQSSEHVDILSNEDVLTDVLTMAAGRTQSLEDRIISEIDDIAGRVPSDISF